MYRFHIGKSGKPAQCEAEIGECPFGENATHYSSKEEAQKHVEENNMRKYNINQGVKKNDSILLINESLYSMNHSDYKKTINFVRNNYNPETIRVSLGMDNENHQELKNVFGKLISDRYFGIDYIRENYELLNYFNSQNSHVLRTVPHVNNALNDYINQVNNGNHTIKNARNAIKISRIILDLSMDNHMKKDSKERISIFRTGSMVPVEEYSGEIADYARNADALRPDNRPGREGNLYGSPNLLGVARWARANATIRSIKDKETREYIVDPHNVFVYSVKQWEDYSWRGQDPQEYWQTGRTLKQWLQEDHNDPDNWEIIFNKEDIHNEPKRITKEQLLQETSTHYDDLENILNRAGVK